MKNYHQKTKDQLIKELEAMRQHMTELESKLANLKSKNDPKGLILRSPREDLHSGIELITDFDVIEAKGINISETGICFESNENLPFEMQFEYEGKLHRHRAHLVWVKRLSEGGYRFGLEFVPPESYPTLCAEKFVVPHRLKAELRI